MAFVHGIRRTRRRSGRDRGRRGFTLLEILIATSILVVGVLGFAQTLVVSMRAQRVAREHSRAAEAARQMVERLQSANFVSLFSTYNATAGDDPAGGAAPGANFAIEGLEAIDGDADLLPGEIVFPVVAGAPDVLREDLVDADLGLPRDLDRDGFIDGANHAADYRVLPVLVRVRWRGPGGDATYELRTLLGDIP